jgi:hypothetical protein
MTTNCHAAARPGLYLALLATAAGSFHIISPVADMVFAANIWLYGLMLAGVLVYFLVAPSVSQESSMPGGRLFTWAILMLGLMVALHTIAHPASAAPNLRYLMILGIGLGLFHRVSLRYFDKTLSALIWFFAIYGIYSMIVHGLIDVGSIDSNDWYAARLQWLPEDNPLTKLAESGVQSYLVFYSMAITRADDMSDIGLFQFVRWTGFFVEPTDAAYVLGPLVLLCVHRAINISRIWVVPLISLMIIFLWAFASSGFVALFLILILRGLLIPSRNSFFIILKLSSAIVLLASLAAIVIIPEVVLGSKNMAQFEFFERFFLEGQEFYLSPELFGVGVGTDSGYHTYGVTSVIFHHGWLPFLAMLMLLAIVTAASVGLIRTKLWLIGGMGMFVLTILSKYPEITNLYFLFIGVYVLKTWHRYRMNGAG